MLEQSISGGFTEEHFDETELSALETKFVRFLRGSAHTQKTMETEQEAVKTLIADISHQTRTPIANLLVYASLLTESNLPPRQQEQAQALLTPSGVMVLERTGPDSAACAAGSNSTYAASAG